jgi:hypothetical protein
MVSEITIGSRVQFPIKDCPILVVEKIEEVLESIKGNQIDR